MKNKTLSSRGDFCRGTSCLNPGLSGEILRQKSPQDDCVGFTLMEILIALFIFTILSFLLVSALRTVINADTGTEKKAERLHNLQMTLLLMSRDIEQAINRPIVNADGKEEAAFTGTTSGFQLTHTGYANTPTTLSHTTLQRSAYTFAENTLFRYTFPVLDATPKTKAESKILLNNVSEVSFKYLNDKGRFVDQWPEKENSQPLPRGIRIYLTILKWGKMSQLYLVSAEKSDNSAAPNVPGVNPSEKNASQDLRRNERPDPFNNRNRQYDMPRF